MPSLSLLLLGSFICFGLVVGPAQPVPIRCWGYSLFYCIIILFANVFINFSAFCLFYLYFYSVSLPNVSPGGFVHTVHVT